MKKNSKLVESIVLALIGSFCYYLGEIRGQVRNIVLRIGEVATRPWIFWTA